MTKYLIGIMTLLLALAIGTAVWYRGSAAIAQREEAAQKAIAESATQRANNLQGTLDKERKAADDVGKIGTSLEDKKDEAATVPATVLADLNADRLRLREEWSVCKTQLSTASAAPGERDEEAERRKESASRIVRIGVDSDNQLAACQETVTFYQNFYAQ